MRLVPLFIILSLATASSMLVGRETHATSNRSARSQVQHFEWTSQTSGVTSRLRGVSAVTASVAWASGTNSTVLRTSNGGTTWKKLKVTSDNLDFRDIDAVNESTAYVMSAGNGPISRIYKTVDAGVTWTLQFQNEEPKVFLDSMSFWNARQGIVVGDAVDLQFYILTTNDGGQHWVRVPTKLLPPALENEGAFAASGTNVKTSGSSDAWFVTGAASKSRVLRTPDKGKSWRVSDSPLPAGKSAGIFSVTFRDSKHGVIVGGDYMKEDVASDNVANTSDGGISWRLTRGLSGFRSVVAYVPGTKQQTVIALGPTGGDISEDDGERWNRLDGEGFDTISFARSKSIPVGWATGAKGRIGKLTLTSNTR